MKNVQRGMGIFGLLVTLGVIAFIALLVLKLAPVYIEYFTVKKAIAAVARTGATDPAEVRRAFNRQADIDRIDVITDRDIIVQGNTLSFAYDKKIPLFHNISIYIEFEGSSTAGGGGRSF
ncbi:MAG TPA: DUF4845 domain-containing protein [Burkholderiales bacterium]|nr:DUF4845 domain-containing protein [Burkholderiales bacterium]